MEHSVPLRVLLQRLYRSERFRLLVLIYGLLLVLGAGVSYVAGDWGFLSFIVLVPIYLIFRFLVLVFIIGFIAFPLLIAVVVAWAAYELFHNLDRKKEDEKPGSGSTDNVPKQ